MKVDEKFWDGVAEKYAKSPIRDIKAYEYTLARTQSYLRETDQVLEIGCGTAATSLQLAPSVEKIVATDLSASMLEQGQLRVKKAKVANISLVQATPTTAPVGPFDVVMALNLLHLLPKTGDAISAAAERLKPGGLFITKTPCLSEGLKSLKYRMMLWALPLMQRLGKAPFVQFFTIAELEQAVINAGFEIIECGNFPVDPPSRYLVARKI